MKRLAKRMTAVFLSLCLLLAGLCAAPTVPAKAAADEGWVGAWSTSPVEFNLKKMLDLEWIKCDAGIAGI